ncbi:MAG TPA: ThuA domain-containing protein [Polyangia bacterium]|nr:ThuA domain-containing protein [Polyangia bacterium]
MSAMRRRWWVLGFVLVGCTGALPSAGPAVDAASVETALPAETRLAPDIGVDRANGPGGARSDGTGGAIAIADASGATETSGARDANASNRVLIYAVTTNYRHDSIPAAAAALSQAMGKLGMTAEIVGASNDTNKADRTRFTPDALAQYGAVILLANDGEPFGYPADQEIQNLTNFVQNGGALVGLECATDCYGGGFSGPMDGHPKSVPFHTLLGATFTNHSDFGPALCTKVGNHVSVAQLAQTFRTADEIYAFTDFRMDNQVVLTCVSGMLPGMVRPVAWYREEGAGRVFYSALGHPASDWTGPMDPNAESRLVEDHVLPGLLWSMKRSP